MGKPDSPLDAVSKRLWARIKECDLPSPPTVAQQLLALSSGEKVELQQYADVIGQDPALATKVLKTVNSAFFGLRARVRSLDRAVVTLGIKPVRSLALSFSLVHQLRQTGKGFDHKTYWKRSVLAATSARILAKRVGFPRPEEPFLAALLQDIGMLILSEALQEAYGKLSDAANRDHGRLRNLEKEYLQLDHLKVGAWLQKAWNLPEVFHRSVLGSHDPKEIETENQQDDQLIRCVAASGTIADIWVSGETVEACQNAVLFARRHLNLDLDVLDEILEEVANESPAVSRLFDVDVGTPDEIEKILNKARNLAEENPGPAATGFPAQSLEGAPST